MPLVNQQAQNSQRTYLRRDPQNKALGYASAFLTETSNHRGVCNSSPSCAVTSVLPQTPFASKNQLWHFEMC
ncbi:unnamed protein product [Lathyrus sativus]|nr:unnamed protein product [Lathyrus sativus]